MPLGIDELYNLEKSLMKHFDDNISSIVTKLNRMDKLDELFDLIDYNYCNNTVSSGYATGKIVVVGANTVNKGDLEGIVKKLGFDKKRFEWYLDYDQIQRIDFGHTQYNDKYRLILFGASPHSGHGKEDASSIIINLEKTDGYPRVERLYTCNELKITKSNFKGKLRCLLEEGFLRI